MHMNILEVLIKLRDDIKLWATNNFKALDEKIDSKTIPVDEELNASSTNPVQNKAIAEKFAEVETAIEDVAQPNITDDESDNLTIADPSGNIIAKVDAEGIHTTDIKVDGTSIANKIPVWDNKSEFSGDYNELENKPNIADDESDNLVIADENGNIIAKIDADGIETTQVIAANIVLGDDNLGTKLGEFEEHIANEPIHITPEDRTKWDSKSDFSGDYNDLTNKPNISDDGSGEFVIADENGNKIFQVDGDGITTTKVTVDEIVVNGGDSLATETYVDEALANLVNSAPDKLNTLDELAAALGDDENFATTVTNTLAEKASQASLDEHTTNTDIHITAEEREKWNNITVPEGVITEDDVDAKIQEHEDNADIHVTAEDKETWNNKSDFGGSYNDLNDKPNLSEDESGELNIADEEGNVILKANADGVHTTALHATSLFINGVEFENNTNDPTSNPSFETIDLDAVPTTVGNYPFIITKSFEIDGIVFPKYSKGMMVAGDDAVMYAIDPEGTMYTAYYDCARGAWQGARDYSSRTFLKGIAHRGLSSVAPENTIAAFKAAKKAGFKYVEGDVRFTEDNIPVLLHEASVDATSDGTGNINTLTLAEVKALDFGSWFSAEYTGERIPTFEEFIIFCRDNGLHPYIELKAGTTSAQTKQLVGIVRYYGMAQDCTWISFYVDRLVDVITVDKTARIGYVVEKLTVNGGVISTWSLSTDVIKDILEGTAATDTTAIVPPLYTGYNEVFIDTDTYTDEVLNIIKANGIPVEVWTVDTQSGVYSLPKGISGVTSNTLDASKVLSKPYSYPAKTLLAGTYEAVYNIELTGGAGETVIPLSFTSNGTKFVSMSYKIDTDGAQQIKYTDTAGNIEVAASTDGEDTWNNEAYKTITLTSNQTVITAHATLFNSTFALSGSEVLPDQPTTPEVETEVDETTGGTIYNIITDNFTTTENESGGITYEIGGTK